MVPVGYQHLWKAHTCAEKAVCQSSVPHQLCHTIWESFCQPGLIPGAHGASGKNKKTCQHQLPRRASVACKGKRSSQINPPANKMVAFLYTNVRVELPAEANNSMRTIIGKCCC